MMDFNDLYLKDIEIKIIEKVKEASKLMMQDFTILEKGQVQNIVTSNDLNVQHFLFEELKKIIPDSGFFCEEEGLVDINHEYVWIIDPIDGTENYSRGINECCISVCLAINKIRMIGVVYNPYRNECYHAIKGLGSYKNNIKLHVSNRPFSRALFCTSLCLYKKEYEEICLNVLNDIYPRIKDFRRFASCALEICYLAEGKIDMYFEMNVSIWDYSAAYLVLKEAGGECYSYGMEEPDFRKVTIVYGANSKENILELNNTINKYLKYDPYSLN